MEKGDVGMAKRFSKKYGKLTKFSLKCHPIHPGIHKDPSIGAQT